MFGWCHHINQLNLTLQTQQHAGWQRRVNTVQVNEKLREVHQAATTVQRENTSPDVDVVVTSFGGGDEDPLAAGTPTTTPTSADFLSDDERVDLDSVIINVTQVTVVSRLYNMLQASRPFCSPVVFCST